MLRRVAMEVAERCQRHARSAVSPPAHGARLLAPVRVHALASDAVKALIPLGLAPPWARLTLSCDAAGEGVAQHEPWQCAVRLGELIQLRDELQAGLFKGRNDFTTREVVERYVRPTAGAAGCRLLDTQVRAEVLVVHAWDASFVALVDALVTHMRGDTHVALWLHAFAINQLEHDVVLLEVVKTTKRTVFFVDAAGLALRRLWCLSEAWLSVVLRGSNSLEVMCGTLLLEELDTMGRTVNVVTAHTTRPEHVEPLRRLLALDRYPGAAAELNRTIRDGMVRGFERTVNLQLSGTPEERMIAAAAKVDVLSYKATYPDHLDHMIEPLLDCIEHAEAVFPDHAMLATIYTLMGHTCRQLGDLGEALAYYEKGLEASTRLQGEKSEGTAGMMLNVSGAQLALAKESEDPRALWNKALDTCQAAGRILEQLGSPMQTEARLQAYHQLFDATRVEEAEHLLNQTQAVHEALFHADGAGLAQILLARAKLAEIEFGKYKRNIARSLELHQCALDLMRDELGAAHPAVPVTMKEMAFAALMDMTPQKGMVRKEEGARYAAEALAAVEAIHGPFHPKVDDLVDSNRGVANVIADRPRQRAMLERRLTIARMGRGEHHKATRERISDLSKHLSTHWDEAEALELYRVHLDALAASPPSPVGATDVALALVETTRFLTVHGTPAEVCEAVAHAVRRVEQIHGDHHAALLPMLQQSAALAERDGPSLYADLYRWRMTEVARANRVALGGGGTPRLEGIAAA